MIKPYGYFSDAMQEEPEYDPGLEAECPVCHKRLIATPVINLVTISLMAPDDNRSYFYRAHKSCYEDLTSEQETAIDSILIDAIYAARNAN